MEDNKGKNLFKNIKFPEVSGTLVYRYLKEKGVFDKINDGKNSTAVNRQISTRIAKELESIQEEMKIGVRYKDGDLAVKTPYIDSILNEIDGGDEIKLSLEETYLPLFHFKDIEDVEKTKKEEELNVQKDKENPQKSKPERRKAKNNEEHKILQFPGSKTVDIKKKNQESKLEQNQSQVQEKEEKTKIQEQDKEKNEVQNQEQEFEYIKEDVDEFKKQVQEMQLLYNKLINILKVAYDRRLNELEEKTKNLEKIQKEYTEKEEFSKMNGTNQQETNEIVEEFLKKINENNKELTKFLEDKKSKNNENEKKDEQENTSRQLEKIEDTAKNNSDSKSTKKSTKNTNKNSKNNEKRSKKEIEEQEEKSILEGMKEIMVKTGKIIKTNRFLGINGNPFHDFVISGVVGGAGVTASLFYGAFRGVKKVIKGFAKKFNKSYTAKKGTASRAKERAESNREKLRLKNEEELKGREDEIVETLEEATKKILEVCEKKEKSSRKKVDSNYKNFSNEQKELFEKIKKAATIDEAKEILESRKKENKKDLSTEEKNDKILLQYAYSIDATDSASMLHEQMESIKSEILEIQELHDKSKSAEIPSKMQDLFTYGPRRKKLTKIASEKIKSLENSGIVKIISNEETKSDRVISKGKRILSKELSDELDKAVEIGFSNIKNRKEKDSNEKEI